MRTGCSKNRLVKVIPPGNAKRPGVAQSLLRAVAGGEGIVLGLDQGDGDVWFVIQNVVGPLAFAPADQLAAHDDASLGEADLLADLRYPVPPGLSQGGRVSPRKHRRYISER